MKLDYENRTQRTFDLTVMARDRLGLTDTTQVRITVVDVNDNPPAIINLPEPAVFNISGSTREGKRCYMFGISFVVFLLCSAGYYRFKFISPLCWPPVYQYPCM